MPRPSMPIIYSHQAYKVRQILMRTQRSTRRLMGMLIGQGKQVLVERMKTVAAKV